MTPPITNRRLRIPTRLPPSLTVRRLIHQCCLIYSPDMSTTPALDHIAMTVPDLDAQVDRLTTGLGMVVKSQMPGFAVLVHPATDFKMELSASEDGEVHVRHLGFVAEDVDAAHADLVTAGMDSSKDPHRQDFAAMYTSYLQQPGCIEVQLVKYD
jgi:hypothetical protein